MFGGGAGSVTLFALWFITRGASSSPEARRPLGNYGIPEDKADMTGDISEDESLTPEDIQGSKC